MYIARILYPVKVLGPGERIGIWFCGCPRRCPGCSNPELQIIQDRYKISLDTIKNLISQIVINNPVDGFTISGGEPFFQYYELRLLLDFLSTINKDILVYTGYYLEELSGYDLSGIAVLIDGPYLQDKNNNVLLRGSENQHIHILSQDCSTKYKKYLKTAINQIQNFETASGIASVGIHKKGFQF